MSKISPCEFGDGKCLHCGVVYAQRGECEGFVYPEADPEKLAMRAEIDRLTAETVRLKEIISDKTESIALYAKMQRKIVAELAEWRFTNKVDELQRSHDNLQAKLAALEVIAYSDDGAGGEGMKLFLENREMKARLAALEKQEPMAGTIKIGDKILAAPSGSCSTTHFVTINVISNSRAVAPVVNQHTRLHYLKGSDAIATFCALSDLFSGACQETSRVNKPNLYAAAGTGAVPEGWQLVLDADLHMLEETKGEQS